MNRFEEDIRDVEFWKRYDDRMDKRRYPEQVFSQYRFNLCEHCARGLLKRYKLDRCRNLNCCNNFTTEGDI